MHPTAFAPQDVRPGIGWRAGCSAVLGLLFASCLPLTAAALEPSTLTLQRSAAFDSLDPILTNNETSSLVQIQIYSTLLAFAYLERPYKLVPDLLESMPVLASDKLTYTFRLRKGVRFHDNACFPGGKGRELTSDDVLYSLRRYADARLNTKTWFAIQGMVVGLDDYHASTAKAEPSLHPAMTSIAGLHKIDDSTFSIKLTHENPRFLYVLTMMPTAVVPVEAVQMYKDRFGVNPVGTGPFVLKGPVDRKSTLHLVKNPNNYGVYPSVGAPGDAESGLLKDAGKKLPLVDALDLPLIEEAQPAALKFLRGELDWRGLDRANFTKMVVRRPGGAFKLNDEYAPRFNLYSSLGINSAYIQLNMKDALIGSNKLLRQALANAVDTPALIDVLFNGRGRPLESLVPYELPGNERETGAVGHHHDPVLARKLLAQAGYPDGKGLPPISIAFPAADADTHNFFDLLRSQYAVIGVVLKGDFMDEPTFDKAAGSGNFQMMAYGWSAYFPDAEQYFQLLYSKNLAPGPNYGSYASPAYDQAYEAMRPMPDGPARLEYMKTMNSLIKDDVPMIITYDVMRLGVLQKWVGNFKRNLMQDESMFLSVDMAAKKKGL